MHGHIHDSYTRRGELDRTRIHRYVTVSSMIARSNQQNFKKLLTKFYVYFYGRFLGRKYLLKMYVYITVRYVFECMYDV